ncbi:SBBP repeat-containing protein [Telluribacter humicola]
MKKGAILLTSLLIAFVTGCQDHNLEPHPDEDVMAWRAGGTEEDLGHSIAVDMSGNTYVTGFFHGTATFGNSTLTSTGNRDIFIVKYDRKGEVLWAHKAGGNGRDEGRDIAVDRNGNVYITGYFENIITFGSTSLASNGNDDMFLVKYSSNGDVLWAQKTGGTELDQGFGVAVDMNGFVYVTGYFSSTASFGSNSLVSSGDFDIFIAKYNSNGDVQWAQKAGGVSADQGSAITVDESGTIYVTGTFSVTATFGTVTHSSITSSVSSDVFVARYSSSGEALWVRSAGSYRSDFTHSIAVDKAGNIYIVGSFRDSFFIGSIRLQAGIATSDAFLAKFNNSGEVQWAQNIGGGYENQLDDGGHDIAVNETGDIYVTGYIRGTPVYFGAVPPNLSDPQITLSSKGSDDVFIARYGSDGKVHWARNEGGTDTEAGQSIAVDQSGNVYITGSFNGTTILGATTLTSGGGSDIFVAKFK